MWILAMKDQKAVTRKSIPGNISIIFHEIWPASVRIGIDLKDDKDLVNAVFVLIWVGMCSNIPRVHPIV